MWNLTETCVPPIPAFDLDDIVGAGARLSIDAQTYPEHTIKQLVTLARDRGGHVIIRRADTIGALGLRSIAKLGGAAVTIEI
jgi:hypothetical protein